MVAESKQDSTYNIRNTIYEITARTIIASHKATQDKTAAQERLMRSAVEINDNSIDNLKIDINDKESAST